MIASGLLGYDPALECFTRWWPSSWRLNWKGPTIPLDPHMFHLSHMIVFISSRRLKKEDVTHKRPDLPCFSSQDERQLTTRSLDWHSTSEGRRSGRWRESRFGLLLCLLLNWPARSLLACFLTDFYIYRIFFSFALKMVAYKWIII